MAERRPRVAVVDYGLGNLFSVRQACVTVGLDAEITSDPAVVSAADAIILPGVAAFGDGMAALHERRLIEPLRAAARDGTPLVGICLGMQLMLSESEEFGRHEGLGLIEGRVVRFREPKDPTGRRAHLKVPHVGWSAIRAPDDDDEAPAAWRGTPFDGLRGGTSQYFVHSFYAVPSDKTVALAFSQYGDTVFCSSLQKGNLFACQFHPERSGTAGIHIYRNIAARIANRGQRG